MRGGSLGIFNSQPAEQFTRGSQTQGDNEVIIKVASYMPTGNTAATGWNNGYNGSSVRDTMNEDACQIDTIVPDFGGDSSIDFFIAASWLVRTLVRTSPTQRYSPIPVGTLAPFGTRIPSLSP